MIYNTIKQNDIELRTQHNSEGLKEASLISKNRKVDIYKHSENNWFVGLSRIDRDNESGINPRPQTIRTYTEMSDSEALSYFDKKQKQLGFFENI